MRQDGQPVSVVEVTGDHCCYPGPDDRLITDYHATTIGYGKNEFHIPSVKTLQTQDILDMRHLSTSAEVSIRHFGTSAKLSRHIGTKEDTSALDNTGPSPGKADSCACVITIELGLLSL